MKKYLPKTLIKYLLKLVLISTIILVVLDTIYTEIYSHPIYKRNKVSWLKNIENDQQFDYALFGSSRCNFHLNPTQIYSETGLKGINLAYPAATNFEIKLMVKEFLKTQHAKNIFIQVDKVYNKEDIDELAIAPFIPFIGDDSIYEDISAYDELAFVKKYIPFYRYMYYDSKLGFRELIMTFTKDNDIERNMGFSALGGQMKKKEKRFIDELRNTKNNEMEEIIEICKKNEIECYFFTSPYYNSVFNTDVLKRNLPNYSDFSKSINDVTMFRDYQHLNAKGATEFTEIFLSNFFNKVK